MLTEDQAREVIGATAYGDDGEKIGKVGQLFLDDQTGQPEFVTVNTGFFGTSESFVPVADATFNGDRLVVPFSKDKVKDAPNVDLDGRHLDESEEQRLYEYYGLSSSQTSGYTDTGRTDTDTTAAGYADTTRTTDTDRDITTGTEGHDTSGPTTDDAMTRSEEQLRVGTETREAGRARLRKRVVTEQQNVTVPVSHEEVTVEREPITDANRGAARSGPAISEEEHEVTLHAERPVVDKEAVPLERVRLGKETRTERETLGGEVRKEQIEVDTDDRPRPRRGDRRR
jgi:uncharacterized protein (TIGR02271 family)